MAAEESNLIYKSFDFIANNADVIFSGIGVAALGFIYSKFKGKDKKTDKNNKNNNIITNNINIPSQQNNNNNNNDENVLDNEKNIPKALTEEKIKEIKNNTKILFIDDDTRFKVVKILNKSGWLNSKLVKDIESLDCHDVVNADIIFVDVQGVGVELNFKEEGLGLASALKDKYPQKKIIIYSAEQKGDRFHEALRKVDDFLAKDVDPYQFTSVVEKFAGLSQ